MFKSVHGTPPLALVVSAASEVDDAAPQMTKSVGMVESKLKFSPSSFGIRK